MFQAIWLFSSDTQLTENGDETNIDCKNRFFRYMRRICEGLRDGADWAKDLFCHWDSVLFPNAENSLGKMASANRQAEDAEDDELDDVFRAAARNSARASGECF
jgi:hypothetical protein